MTAGKIIGWRNYAVAALCILTGVWALSRGSVASGVEGILAGLFIVSLRDALGKVLRAVDDNRQSLDGLRAAIETELSRKG